MLEAAGSLSALSKQRARVQLEMQDELARCGETARGIRRKREGAREAFVEVG